MIVSKRHFFKFYFALVFSTLFFIALIIILIYTYIKRINDNASKNFDFLMPIFAIFILLLAIYNIYRCIKNAPNIKMDKDFISFNNEIFSTEDIGKVILSGKHDFNNDFFILTEIEGASIKFKNGIKKIIFDDMYSNTWEMKSFLKQVIIDKKVYDPLQFSFSKVENYGNENFENFKGNQFLTFRGFSFWVIIIFLIYAAFDFTKMHIVNSIYITLGGALVWFLLHIYFLHYFQVSNNYLVIRNHIQFWKKVPYLLSDIKEVVFETQPKMPNCLRVITKDFKTKLYPAGTLSNKTWDALQQKFREHKIKVRIEI